MDASSVDKCQRMRAGPGKVGRHPGAGIRTFWAIFTLEAGSPGRENSDICVGPEIWASTGILTTAQCSGWNVNHSSSRCIVFYIPKLGYD